MKVIQTSDEIAPLCQDPHHLSTIQQILKRLTPYKNSSLPWLKLIPSSKDPVSISLFFLSRERPHVGKFLSEMMTRWLIPSKQLPISLFFMAPFFSKKKDTPLLCGQIELQLKSPKDMSLALCQFEVLKLELELGFGSPYHAARILEMKALSLDEKRMLIQERVTRIVHRFPSWYDYDIFSLMQHLFIKVSAEYLRCREIRQFTENLTFFYSARKKFYKELEQFPDRRFIFTKVSRRGLRLPLGLKSVLGVLVGVNLLHENEKFGTDHLLKAVHSLVSGLAFVPGSDLLYQDTDYPFQLFYIELEKKEGKQLLKEEVDVLRDQLQPCIKGRVEHLHRSVFMPRNEEEIMRHIVTLGKELRFLSDLPQVIISFAKQTDDQLIFTLIIVRVLLPRTPSIEDVFSGLSIKAHLQRSKVLGFLRKRHPKEALVLDVEMQMANFLREDNCIDLYKARHKILLELEKGLGTVRDFNGGIIAKQNEVFQELVLILGKRSHQHHLLLDAFFHNIYPVERRSFIQPKILKMVFLGLVQLLQEPPGNKMGLKKLQTKECCFLLIEPLDFLKKSNFEESLASLEMPLTDLITIKLEFEQRCILGYLYVTEDRKKQENALKVWKKTIGF